MEFSAYEEDNRLYYQITKVDAALEKTLSGHGYAASDGVYLKSFPLPIPHRDKIIGNFLRHAEAAFTGEAASEPMKWREGFAHFASIARRHGLDWWTTGKILLPLHGLDAEIDDVDFYFHLKDLDRVRAAFADDILEPVAADTWRARAFEYYGLAYAHCPVCLFVAPRAGLDTPEPVHFGPYASEHLTTVRWDGFDVKVPPIELYIKTLRRWGKHDYAESIEKALNRNDTGAVPCV